MLYNNISKTYCVQLRCAQRYCNINLKLNDKITVVFHNVKIYDSYLTMQELLSSAKKPGGREFNNRVGWKFFRHLFQIKSTVHVFNKIIKLNKVAFHGYKLTVEEAKVPPRTICRSNTFIKSSNLLETLPSIPNPKPLTQLHQKHPNQKCKIL